MADDDALKSLVWIASYPKSGSTWLRLFLHAYLAGKSGLSSLGKTGDNGDLNLPLYEAVSPIPLEDVTVEESIYLRTAALYGLAKADIGDQLMKTHCARRTVAGVDLIPDAMTKGAIYVVRDPRDVAVSFSHHLGKSIDTTIEYMRKDLCLVKNGVRQYLSTWSDNVASWQQGAFPILVIRYEDMQSGDAFPHIVRMFDGECDEKRLAAAIEACEFGKLQAEEKAKGFLERPPKADSFFRAGRSTWRETLSEKQVAQIEADHGEMMQKLGYVPELVKAA